MRRILNLIFFGLLCLFLGAYVQRLAQIDYCDWMEERYQNAMVENIKLHSIIGPYRWLDYNRKLAGFTAI